MHKEKNWTIEDIKQAQKEAANRADRAWWFGPGETRFFSSRIESEVFSNPAYTGHWFVTSEQCEFSDGTAMPRLYSVRCWDEHAPDQVDTWGKFQQFKTKDAAIRVAQQLAKNGGTLSLKVVEDEES